MIFLGVTSGEKKDILARVDIDRRQSAEILSGRLSSPIGGCSFTVCLLLRWLGGCVWGRLWLQARRGSALRCGPCCRWFFQTRCAPGHRPRCEHARGTGTNVWVFSSRHCRRSERVPAAGSSPHGASSPVAPSCPRCKSPTISATARWRRETRSAATRHRNLCSAIRAGSMNDCRLCTKSRKGRVKRCRRSLPLCGVR